MAIEGDQKQVRPSRWQRFKDKIGNLAGKVSGRFLKLSSRMPQEKEDTFEIINQKRKDFSKLSSRMPQEKEDTFTTINQKRKDFSKLSSRMPQEKEDTFEIINQKRKELKIIEMSESSLSQEELDEMKDKYNKMDITSMEAELKKYDEGRMPDLAGTMGKELTETDELTEYNTFTSYNGPSNSGDKELDELQEELDELQKKSNSLLSLLEKELGISLEQSKVDSPEQSTVTSEVGGDYKMTVERGYVTPSAPSPSPKNKGDANNVMAK